MKYMRRFFKMKKISLLSVMLLVGCSINGNVAKENDEIEQQKQFDYSDVTTSIHWTDVFLQEEERYLVYFYSEYCGYCKSIKEEFLSYYLLDKETIYFVDAIKEDAVFCGNAENIIGMKSIEDFYIPGTPFLLEIIENTATNYYVGLENIRLYINENKS